MFSRTARVTVVTAALALLMALPGTALADHPSIGGAEFTPGGSGVNSGGEGAEWTLEGSFLTGNPHSDLDFFEQGGNTYASVGTIAAGVNGGGQTIVQLSDAEGALAPAFVASHPSASCITDPAAALGLQHDVEATPKGDVPLNTEWGDLAVREDTQLLIDATDAEGRCHDNGVSGQGLIDAPRGGLEFVDVTDITAPTEIGLTSHIGEAHTVNVDPSRPHIVYSVTSDAVSVSTDDDDCDGDGDTEELIRENECSEDSDRFDLDGFEVLDISSCLNFPDDATIEEKRGIADDGTLIEGEGCRPLVYRYRYEDLDMSLGHTNLGIVYGCHELEVYPDDTLTCGGGSALLTFDISGMFNDNGTPDDRTDDTINGDPLPCRLRASTSTPDRATDASVLDCVEGGTEEAPVDLTVAGWIAAGAPSVEGIEHVASAYHMGRESLTGAFDPAFPATEDIDFNHESEYTHSGNFLLATDERGGGVLPPGATCTEGIDNTAGNGGVNAYVTDQLLAERPVPVTTAGESAFDPELAFASYARTPATEENPEGEKAIFRATVRTGAQATICTAHVFQQIPGQNRIFMGWYSQGTQVIDYIEHPDGTFEFREVGYFIPEAADEWVSHIYDVTENEDGTFTYAGAIGDFRLTEAGRNAIDVYSVTLPPPAQFAADVVEPVVIERINGSGAIDTAVAVSQDAFPDGSNTALLGRVDEYADNLAGGPLAAAEEAPLLYTETGSLNSETAAEIERLGATRVIVLGGTAAVSQAVEDELAADGVTVERLGGANRFETAALIAAELGSATGTAFVVEGENTDPERGFPDPLSIAPLAGFRGDPILLVNRDRLPQETIDAMADLGISDVVITGGTAAVSQTVEDEIAATGTSTERLAGDTRYETSQAVYERQVAEGMDPSTLTLATGLDWPNALAAGPVSAITGTTFAIIDGQGGADTLEALLEANLAELRTIRLIGDTSVITTEVEQDIRAAVTPEAVATEERTQTAGVVPPMGTDAALAIGGLLLLGSAVVRRRRGQLTS
ncbi:MAG: cell wall-binding repeat-containing protein [Euzebya sp.]